MNEQQSNELTHQDPLMQPIFLNGRQYQTSHFLHRYYQANSPHGGKYRQHSHFIRLLKGLETYQYYLDLEDIVVISSGCPELGQPSKNKALYDAFRAVSHKTLYLVNATIQVALAHHLDDEVSKKLSVATNTAIARELTSPNAIIQALAQGHVALEQGHVALVTRVHGIEQHLATIRQQRDEKYTELAIKYSRLEALEGVKEQQLAEQQRKITALEHQLNALTPPPGWKTLLYWCRETVGDERQALWIILRSPFHVNRQHELDYLEYLARKEMERLGGIPTRFPTDHGRFLHVPYTVFRVALDQYISQQKERGIRPHIVHGPQKFRAQNG